MNSVGRIHTQYIYKVALEKEKVKSILSPFINDEIIHWVLNQKSRSKMIFPLHFPVEFALKVQERIYLSTKEFVVKENTVPLSRTQGFKISDPYVCDLMRQQMLRTIIPTESKTTQSTDTPTVWLFFP